MHFTIVPVMIVAGNHAEASLFADAVGLFPKQWRYVGAAEALAGWMLPDLPVILYVGNWHQHPEIAHIKAAHGGILAFCVPARPKPSPASPAHTRITTEL